MMKSAETIAKQKTTEHFQLFFPICHIMLANLSQVKNVIESTSQVI